MTLQRSRVWGSRGCQVPSTAEGRGRGRLFGPLRRRRYVQPVRALQQVQVQGKAQKAQV
jgi:hypothetical protein